MRATRRGRDLISAAAAAAVVGAASGALAAGGPAPGAGSSGAPAFETDAPGGPACTVEFVPGRVAAGRADTRVLAETDASFRSGPPRVEAPRGSGIRVRDVKKDVSEGSWILLLDLTEARPGTWSVTLERDGVRCSGQLGLRESVGRARARPTPRP